ncbi:ABC transporter permease [Parabacteroides sp. AM58-2XD]|uniref:ABC transporter permease n=1 Tax=Parabacteroides TaxID=375288 RepID=UPI000FE27B65|nr:MULTISPECIES: ABC transporter permease [Parabacteroides]RGY92652.1 ABC transporter permease [Parabacteroides sp. AM58-2XD]GKG71725.1 ABC transporter permease [Parabacteroides goldsteinii]GKG77660.1 ABC transporter permease [Parabacteroides goldsteinii]
MYRIYFKQSLLMLKQNKFISAIAIIGTALAIMMIMTIIVADEIKGISSTPEINRERTLHINYQVKKDTTKNSWQAGTLSYDVVKDYLYPLKTPRYVSAVNSVDPKRPSTLVSREGSSEIINAGQRLTDATYWKIFSFSFIKGRPFNEGEFNSGISVAVVSETLAKKAFKGETALGQTILVNFKPYRIIGIVKDVSPVFKRAYGDLWVPYSSLKKENLYFDVVIMAEKTSDFAAITAEVRNMEKKYNIENVPWTLFMKGPLDNQFYQKDIWGNSVEDITKSITIQNRKMIFILLILLLIPAINLSGLSLSRMKKRTEEIGIRKAFGAKRYTILIQVLFENLITSLIGGVIGLILSYVVVFRMRDWLLDIPSGSTIQVNTLISIPVLLAVFAVCLVINLLSAGIPAYRASRMKIINSLNQNDN